MCGIFGIIAGNNSDLKFKSFEGYINRLFRLSETRGQEASGLVVSTRTDISVLKKNVSPRVFLDSLEYKKFLSELNLESKGEFITEPVIMFGHARLATNGVDFLNSNNHPIITDNIVGIHNGIITNLDELANKYRGYLNANQLDSKQLFKLIDLKLRENKNDVYAVLTDVFLETQGSFSIGFIQKHLNIFWLATNNGSLYYAEVCGKKVLIFASEKNILREFMETNAEFDNLKADICQLQANAILGIENNNATLSLYSQSAKSKILCEESEKSMPKNIRNFEGSLDSIVRCSKCILPQTHPFITFDEMGVCNYCRNYEPTKLLGRQKLDKILSQHRSKDGSPDCIVAFSGGRDSSYGLHVLKTEYGMNPVAFTYDWGMVTDVARRNQARVVGKLGIEHIIRAANLHKKRGYMNKNIKAWLRRPKLGMVPLFMAGDKFFFDVSRKLKAELRLPLVIYCAGGELEYTDFKTGFAGVKANDHGNRLFGYGVIKKIQLLMYYSCQYLMNPRYLNESLYESINSFRATFVSKEDSLFLYHYLDWDEATVNDTLKTQYNWESAEHTSNSWRIGDGYTSFINYIYYHFAGFSEFDVFRSNQVRKGVITRDKALQLAAKDNEVDPAILREFGYQIGLNMEETMSRISSFPRKIP